MLTKNWDIKPVDENTCALSLTDYMGNPRERVMPVSADTMQERTEKYYKGALIQHAFPDPFTANDREFMLTGMTDDEWEKLWGAV